MSKSGGLSITALIGFVLFVGGVVTAVLVFVLNKKKLLILAAILFVLSAVFVFLIHFAGTSATMKFGDESQSMKYSYLVQDLNIQIGTILFAISGVLSAVSCVLLKVLPEKELINYKKYI